MAAGGGNEFVIGAGLACWLLLSCVGVRLPAPGQKKDPVIAGLFGMGVLGPLSLVVLLLTKTFIAAPGVIPAPHVFLLLAAGVLAPVVLLSGWLFRIFVSAQDDGGGKMSIPGVYGLEASGSVLGGIAATLGFNLHISSMDVLVGAGMVCLALTALMATRRSLHRRSWLLASAGGAVLLLWLAGEPETALRRASFPGEDLLAYEQTPYGDLAVTRTGEQVNIYRDYQQVTLGGDPAFAEDLAHTATAQRAGVRRILQIGGGASGVLHEHLKYPVDRVDYVEPDPLMVKYLKETTAGFGDARLQVMVQDPVQVLRTSAGGYDVILLQTGPPSTLQANRYFTQEFLSMVRSNLRPGGLLDITLASSADYAGEEARLLRGVLAATLRSLFPHVLIIPGQADHLLASQEPLSTSVAGLVEERKVTTTYLNRWYVNDTLLAARAERLAASLPSDVPLNTDLHPTAYLLYLRYWLSFFGSPVWVLVALAVFLGTAAAVRPGLRETGVFAAGFALMTAEVLLMVLYQIAFGQLSVDLGILVAAMMGGLSSGSLLPGARGFVPYVRAALGLAICTAVVGLFAGLLVDAAFSGVIRRVLFLVLAAGTGFLGGRVFRAGSWGGGPGAGTLASRLYSSDLLGAASGALLVSTVLIPVIGMTGAAWTATGVSVAAAGALHLAGKKG
jgi:spermidine synthase